MDTINIRLATKQDSKTIVSVLHASQWFTYENLFSKKYIQKLINQYYNEERIGKEIVSISEEWHGYYVAELSGRIVGVIGGGMTNQTTGEIYVFYMDPVMRGKGIGTRLLTYYTKIQKHIYGATEQWVAVAKENDYGIPFYESRGFIFQYEELSYGALENELDVSLKYKREI
ncbi:GNAT family N-acetyltransferase [Sporosarcina sp. FA9]|uniref:GNAT family N-acetyltransferase n=1 Tax=Sporosarcina sp. FA9 TaxID=3413030 RepID=UPI003F65FC00